VYFLTRYHYHDKIKEEEMGMECMEKLRSTCEISAGNTEGKREVVRPSFRWEGC
jgi:hypothetical protein